MRSATPLALVITLILAAGCTGMGSKASPSRDPNPSTSATTAESVAALAEIERLCAPGPGRTVTPLDPLAIPPITWKGVSRVEIKVGAKTVPGNTVPDIDLPATQVAVGCLVVYEAPAGCLPKVELSPVVIPGLEIPGFSYLRPDGVFHTVAALRLAPVVGAGTTADAVCQEATAKANNTLPAVTRAAIQRAPVSRPAANRGAEIIHYSVCDGGDCVPGLATTPLLVPAVNAAAESVRAAILPSRKVGDAIAQDGETSSAYQAPADVMFAYGTSQLTPVAQTQLDQILADANAHGLTGKVRVEGHTDDTGDAAANIELSAERARAVADYLVDKGVERTRISVTGRGESSPRYPNDTDSHRAINRRVVVEFNKP